MHLVDEAQQCRPVGESLGREYLDPGAAVGGDIAGAQIGGKIRDANGPRVQSVAQAVEASGQTGQQGGFQIGISLGGPAGPGSVGGQQTGQSLGRLGQGAGLRPRAQRRELTLELGGGVAALGRRWAVMGVALLTFLATAYLFVEIPKGFFPQEDIGQINVSTEAAEDTSFDAMVKLQTRVAEIFRADPNVATVNSFNGGGGSQNTGRLFINLKPRAERKPMKEVIEGLRGKLREVPGIAVFMRPTQNLQLGGRPSKAQYQYILQSVRADELNEWATKLQDKLGSDPLFRDVTSDAQLRALLTLETAVEKKKLHSILHYDGLPMSAAFVVDGIEKALDKGVAA